MEKKTLDFQRVSFWVLPPKFSLPSSTEDPQLSTRGRLGKTWEKRMRDLEDIELNKQDTEEGKSG